VHATVAGPCMFRPAGNRSRVGSGSRRAFYLCQNQARDSEPPDLFWWCRVHATLEGDSTNRQTSQVERRAQLEPTGRRILSSPWHHQHQVGGSLARAVC